MLFLQILVADTQQSIFDVVLEQLSEELCDIAIMKYGNTLVRKSR